VLIYYRPLVTAFVIFARRMLRRRLFGLNARPMAAESASRKAAGSAGSADPPLQMQRPVEQGGRSAGRAREIFAKMHAA
jgi:hypothetical protein